MEKLKNISLSDENRLLKFAEELKSKPRTEYIKFENNTSQWNVEVMLYEARQKRNLPPPDGYEEWTGVTVGGTDIRAGQEVYAYLQKIVQGDFVDCGLLNLKNSVSGRVIRTWNFQDRTAPQGKFYRYSIFGIKDKSRKKGEESLIFTFEGELLDGTIERKEYTIE